MTIDRPDVQIPPPPPQFMSRAPLPAPPVGHSEPNWATRALGISVAVESTDRMAWLTWLTLVTVGVGVICAAIGHIPVDLPMPTHLIGMVTPTCGLTRGTVAILRGHWSLALRYNPVSFLVPVGILAAVVRIMVGRLVHHGWLNVRFHPTRLAWAIGGVLFVALGVYQQSHAMFIMHSHIV